MSGELIQSETGTNDLDHSLHQDDEGFVLPDLEQFADLPQLHDQLVQLMRQAGDNAKLVDALNRHARKANTDGRRVMGTRRGPHREIEITADDHELLTMFGEESPGDMLAYLRRLVEELIETISTNAKGASLGKILQRREYDNPKLYAIVRAIRVLPAYKMMLDQLEEVWARRTEMYLRMNMLINIKCDRGLDKAEAAERQQLEEQLSRESQAVAQMLRELELERYAELYELIHGLASFEDQSADGLRLTE